MPTYGIILNVAGPGTGPSEPHSYGRTDATHRYLGTSLGAVDSIVNSWPDLIGTADFTTPAGLTQTLTVKAESGGYKSAAQPNASLSGTQTQRLDRTGVTGVRTIVQVLRTATAAAGGSRNFFRSMHQWRAFVGGSNGQPGVAPVSGSGGSGLVVGSANEIGTGIEILAISVNPSGGAAQLKAHNAAAVTGTLTLGTASTSDGLFGGDTVALDGRLIEHIEFNTVLTATEMQTVMSALASHYKV